MTAPLDSIDAKIVRLLRTDGRLPNAKLAEAVGLSPSACLRRLRALEESGVIRGYVAIIEESPAAEVTVAIVHITLERQTEDFLSRFENAARKIPEVCECYLMTGLADYVLRVETHGVADYERVHKEQLARLPGVARIQSSFAIRTVVRQTVRALPGRGPKA